MMKKNLVLLLLLAVCIGAIAEAPAVHSGITTVILVRHAEKMKIHGNDDPGLTAQGEERAAELARALGSAGVTAVFASQYKRTYLTAEPVAKKLGLKVQQVNADKTAELVDHLLKEHAGKTSLVVGHSDTVPEIIAALGGPKLPELGDNEYDSLFILTRSNGQTSVTKLKFGAH